MSSQETPAVRLMREKVRQLEAENTRLADALRHYADDSNWINDREFKSYPGLHGNAVARGALWDGEAS